MITVCQDRNEARTAARHAKDEWTDAHVRALYPGSRPTEILRERYDEPPAVLETQTIGFEDCADVRAEAHLAIETRRESWLLAADEHGSLTERDRAGYVFCLARESLERSGIIGIVPYRVRAMFQ